MCLASLVAPNPAPTPLASAAMSAVRVHAGVERGGAGRGPRAPASPAQEVRGDGGLQQHRGQRRRARRHDRVRVALELVRAAAAAVPADVVGVLEEHEGGQEPGHQQPRDEAGGDPRLLRERHALISPAQGTRRTRLELDAGELRTAHGGRFTVHGAVAWSGAYL